MLSKCGFVIIQKEPVYIGDGKDKWEETFRIGGFRRPRQGLLIFGIRHLTHKEVPVRINDREIGEICPLGRWEVFQTGWFTQMISFGGSILRNGDNKIDIRAQELPEEYEKEFDDLDLKEVICFYR